MFPESCAAATVVVGAVGGTTAELSGGVVAVGTAGVLERSAMADAEADADASAAAVVLLCCAASHATPTATQRPTTRPPIKSATPTDD